MYDSDNFIEAIKHTYGKVKVTCEGSYSTLNFIDKKNPSESDILECFEVYAKHLASVEYQNKRVAEYPSIGEQLDSIFKGLKAVRDGEQLPKDTIDWLSQIEAVKNKYPKG